MRFAYQLIACAAIGIAIGISLGLARYCNPSWFH